MSERKTIIRDRDTARRVISAFRGHCMEQDIDSALEDAPQPVCEGTSSRAVETEESKTIRLAWAKANKKAKGYLLQHLTPDDAESVSLLTAAQTVTWVESRYIAVRVQNSFTSAVAIISTTKVDRNDTWPQILTKFNKIESAASTINNLSNDDIGIFGPIAVAGFLLNALPDKYGALYQAYMENLSTNLTSTHSLSNSQSKLRALGLLLLANIRQVSKTVATIALGQALLVLRIQIMVHVQSAVNTTTSKNHVGLRNTRRNSSTPTRSQSLRMTVWQLRLLAFERSLDRVRLLLGNLTEVQVLLQYMLRLSRLMLCVRMFRPPLPTLLS